MILGGEPLTNCSHSNRTATVQEKLQSFYYPHLTESSQQLYGVNVMIGISHNEQASDRGLHEEHEVEWLLSLTSLILEGYLLTLFYSPSTYLSYAFEVFVSVFYFKPTGM